MPDIRAVAPAALAAAVVLLAAAPAAASWVLVWQDEFDGTQLDPTRWTPQIGTGCPNLCGWGNNELQYYRAENATVSGGFLTITAREQSFGGADYTSARLRTRNLGDWTYGRFEMRARMPIGQGLWPAFWMLPTDEVYGGWAASGEIDIMEYLGHEPEQVFGTLHYGGSFPANVFTSNGFTLGSGTFHDDFHEFALEWDPCEFRWYVDGALYATQTNWWSTGGPYPAPFDERFHLILNLAVGGNLPGPPDGTTTFPQELVVDWVRVYQRDELDLGSCTIVFDDMDHADPTGNGWFVFGGTVGGGGIGPNQTDLPPGDSCGASLQSGWGSGGVPGFFGGFGRTNPLDLTGATHFELWIHPDPGQDYTLEINLQDDDDGNGSIPSTPDGADDEFQYDLRVSPSGGEVTSGGGWQRVSLPLGDFFDDNSFHFGGNGVLDPVPPSAGGNGELINIVVTILGESGSNVTFRTDRWAFTRRTASISGRVWSDTDADGVPDGGEPGLGGVALELVNTAFGTVEATATTVGDGTWSFPALLGGDFEVRVDPATLPPDVLPTADPDGTGTPDVFARVLLCDEVATGQDFGYAPSVTGAPDVGTRGGGLLASRPNPFTLRTVVEFDLVVAGPVELAVYDVAGRRVRTLVEGVRAAGLHRVEWDGRDDAGRPVAAGVYFTTLRTGQGRSVRGTAVLR